MRITDQYLWNIIFSLFFTALVIIGAVVIESESYRDIYTLTVWDLIIVTLATWRLVRLFVYDAITKFFREQYCDTKKIKGETYLIKPVGGPRRTLADLLSCPWCFGVWAAALVLFLYVMTPYAYFPLLFLAISAPATFLQILANLIGHTAEKAKHLNER